MDPAYSPHRQLKTERRNQAFTLVEVSLAISVLAFGLVAMFSLLPAGMTLHRRAIDSSLTSFIAQRIIADVQQSDFETVRAAPLTARYFTMEGAEVSADATSGPVDQAWLYYAEVEVAPAGAEEMPGAVTPPSDNLLRVVVRLGANPSHTAAPFASGTPVPYRTFTSLMARN
jgi:uncharacterized protein (TIGR02598 family)